MIVKRQIIICLLTITVTVTCSYSSAGIVDSYVRLHSYVSIYDILMSLQEIASYVDIPKMHLQSFPT